MAVEEVTDIDNLEKIYQELTNGIELTPDTIDKLFNYNCTDSGNAELFRDLVGDKFRFVPEKGCWFKFNGVRWAEASGEAKLTMLAISRRRIDATHFIPMAEANKDWVGKLIKWSLMSESDRILNASLEVAKCMLTKSYTEFDSNPFLLCLDNGVLDLRVDGGGFRKAKPEDYLHKCAHIKFDPYAEYPRWFQFLKEIFSNDEDLISFIQRAVGYTLTGRASAQCFFICYGKGANGKSTFLDVIQKLLGDFAIATSMDTFKEHNRNNPQIPNDLAALCGKRFVKATELKEGSRLNEERIKTVTGEDSIQARFLHREFFNFDPEFKIWLAVNHKPIIRGTDEAIWRRPKLIPFEAYFSPESRDENLKAKLLDELPGILLWALEGCHLWQILGLNPAGKVAEATRDYQEESDSVGSFLSECTVKKEGVKVKASDLYESFGLWCGGRADLSQRDFGSRMTEKGYTRKRSTGGQFYYLDLGLIHDGQKDE